MNALTFSENGYYLATWCRPSPPIPWHLRDADRVTVLPRRMPRGCKGRPRRSCGRYGALGCDGRRRGRGGACSGVDGVKVWDLRKVAKQVRGCGAGVSGRTRRAAESGAARGKGGDAD